MDNDIGLQWRELCDDFEQAKRSYFNTFAPVIRGFRAVRDGTGGNPTEEQLENMETAWGKWQEAQERMDDFVKKNT